jgi:hypothetical protein
MISCRWILLDINLSKSFCSAIVTTLAIRILLQKWSRYSSVHVIRKLKVSCGGVEDNPIKRTTVSFVIIVQL